MLVTQLKRWIQKHYILGVLLSLSTSIYGEIEEELENLASRALVLFEVGDYTGALSLYEQLLSELDDTLCEETADLHMIVADLKFHDQNFLEAEKRYRKMASYFEKEALIYDNFNQLGCAKCGLFFALLAQRKDDEIFDLYVEIVSNIAVYGKEVREMYQYLFPMPVPNSKQYILVSTEDQNQLRERAVNYIRSQNGCAYLGIGAIWAACRVSDSLIRETTLGVIDIVLQTCERENHLGICNEKCLMPLKILKSDPKHPLEAFLLFR